MRAIAELPAKGSGKMSAILFTMAMALQSTGLDSGLGEPALRGCIIDDVTSTPTNVRARPNGRVLRQLNDQQHVYVTRVAFDNQQREWSLIRIGRNGRPLGWVFSRNLMCN
jgi:hypothetical protein